MGVSPASAKVQNWNYDNSGNWTSTTKTIGNNTTTENRQHSVSDQVTQIGNNAATHDAKGNLTAYEINGKEYEVDYDLDNRIIKADIDGDDVEYRYDAFGRRVIRKEGSTKTALIWWANSECAEYKHSSGQASIQNDLFAHPSRLNAVIARAVDGSKSKLQWYHKNYLDHVYAVSDDDGDILEHYRYTAFGEVTIYNATGVQQTTTQINNQILWNTRRRDTVSGYYMYKFRHYSAELGRWPARDPIEEKGGVNLYGFVGNDPVGRWDAYGLDPKKYTYEIAKKILLNYKDVSYSEHGKQTSTEVYKLIGGWLYGEHMRELANKKIGEKKFWYNSCAVRLSIAFTRSGFDFSKVNGKHDITAKGKLHNNLKADVTVLNGKKNILIAASSMRSFLKSKFGKPDYLNELDYNVHKKEGDIIIFASGGHTGTATGKNRAIGGTGAMGHIWVARRPKKNNECEEELDWKSPPKFDSGIEIQENPTITPFEFGQP